jgi:hypothetical protein
LPNSVANSIFYNVGGFSLNIIRPKALTKGICQGDLRVACSFIVPRFVLSVHKFQEKTSFSRAYRQKQFDQFQCNFNANSILYNFRWSSLHIKRPKALSHAIRPGDFRVAWSNIFWTGDLFFFYINFRKIIIFKSLPFKSHLTNAVANSILYNFGESSWNIKRPKALTQVICQGVFRVALSFFAPAICFLISSL